MVDPWTIMEPEGPRKRPPLGRPRRDQGRIDGSLWEAELRRAMTYEHDATPPVMATARHQEMAGVLLRPGRGHDPDLIMGRPDVVQPPRL